MNPYIAVIVFSLALILAVGYGDASVLKTPWGLWGVITASASASVWVWYFYNKCSVPPKLVYNTDESDMKTLVSSCPTLTERHPATPWAINRHIATLVGVWRKSPEVNYKREFLDLADGGIMALDTSYPSTYTDTTPVIIICHGLNGGSRSNYVLHLAHMANNKGWIAVALNNRGLNETELKTPRIVCGSFTHDLEMVINHTKARYPNAPLYAIGCSLGANLLMKYLGTTEHVPLNAAISVSNPLDFGASVRQMSTGIYSLYDLTLTKDCVATFKRHAHHFESVPSVNPKAVLSARRLREFDEHFTSKVWSYNTVEDYYHDSSSVRYLEGVKIPLLIFTARDDPVVDERALPYELARTHKNVILAVTECGGHLGFPEGWSPTSVIPNTVDRIASEFFTATNTFFQGQPRPYSPSTATSQ